MTKGMVLVGGGECAAHCAFELRRFGYRGSITLVGSEPHLPYERPPLSKHGAAQTREPPAVAAVESYRDAGIELVLGSPAVAIERAEQKVRLASGREIGYERLLVATGAIPRRLLFPGDAVKMLHVLRTIDDAARLYDAIEPSTRVLILGGGLIGLELTSNASRLGAVVTVVEAADRVMARAVPVEIAEAIAAHHRAEGAEIICGDTVARASVSSRGVSVELASGRVITVDRVVVAVGVVPAIELAARAGLEINNGVAVNACLRTSDPRILAAGDCCSFPLGIYGERRVRLESWRNAVEQGQIAGRNMLGACEQTNAVPWFWSEQYDLVLQVTGIWQEDAKTVRRDLGDGAFVVFCLDGTRLIAAAGVGRGNKVAKPIALAERLIQRGVQASVEELEDPTFNLKHLMCQPA